MQLCNASKHSYIVAGIFKSLGIVFRTVKYSESSLILEIFTQEKGLRSFIVSGVRSSKSKQKASLYQHLNILDMVAYDKEENLARIKECKIGFYYQKLPFQIYRSSVGLFILEVAKNSIKEREENRLLFNFIYDRLVLLDEIDKKCLSLFSIKFLLEFSVHIGFMPNNNYSDDACFFHLYKGQFFNLEEYPYTCSAETSNAISEIDKKDINDIHTLSYPRALRNDILDQMIKYYHLHIENFQPLKSIDVLRSIF